MPAAIQVRDVEVGFEGVRVLKGVSFDILEGESLVIAGPSGCGKTVLLKTILGLIEPDAGEVLIAGRNLAALSRKERLEVRSSMGMVFQGGALLDSLSVWENVGFFLLEHTALSPGEIRARVASALKDVGLEGIEEKKPEQLSGGMKKRVAIARAIIGNPRLLFYDEPTTGLDPITSDSITELMLAIHARFSTTDVSVTHDVKLASCIADRIALLDDGELAEIGTPEDLKGTSRDPLLRSYLEARCRIPPRGGSSKQRGHGAAGA